MYFKLKYIFTKTCLANKYIVQLSYSLILILNQVEF